MSSKKIVIFGPWCGEFSYEYGWWVPEIRKKRNTEYSNFYAVHIGYEGRSFLYRDFIDEYITYPKDIEESLTYPSNYGQKNQNDTYIGIPDNLIEFLKEVINSVEEKFDDVVCYIPEADDGKVSIPRAYQQQPYGEYLHYNPCERIINEVKKQICFEDSSRKMVSILARTRHRAGKRCNYDWSPKNWEIFIDMLINLMDLNVCIVDIPPKKSSAGTLSFIDSEVYKRNKNYIKIFTLEGSDSLERQAALLQLSDCNIYGGGGSSSFAYFLKTPLFTQQTVKEGPRRKFQWHADLTDNFKNVYIFSKYDESDIYDSSPVEMFCVFQEFFKGLVGDYEK
jgi:hypothetical protein